MLLSDSIRKTQMHIHKKILNKKAEMKIIFIELIKKFSLLHLYTVR